MDGPLPILNKRNVTQKSFGERMSNKDFGNEWTYKGVKRQRKTPRVQYPLLIWINHLFPNCETFKETASELLSFLTPHMMFDEISNKSKLNKL